MEIVGKIIQICEPQGGIGASSGKPWKKRQYVLETQETYPKKVCFTAFGEDRVNNFDTIIALGKVVKVSVDIESREYMNRWYTDVNAWKVEEAAASTVQQPEPTQSTAGNNSPVPPPPIITSSSSDEELPF